MLAILATVFSLVGPPVGDLRRQSTSSTLPERAASPIHSYKSAASEDRSTYTFGSRRRFRGIWVNDFEASNFVEGARTLESALHHSKRIWLTIGDATIFPGKLRPQRREVYFIKFEGRATRINKSGHGFGHLGMSSGLVVAERVVSIRDIGFYSSLPPPRTRGEVH